MKYFIKMEPGNGLEALLFLRRDIGLSTKCPKEELTTLSLGKAAMTPSTQSYLGLLIVVTEVTLHQLVYKENVDRPLQLALGRTANPN